MKRVVITGLGVVSPLSCDKDTFWGKILEGKNSIKDLTKLDSSIYGVPCRSSEINVKNKQFDENIIKDFQKHGKAVMYAASAVKMSLKDAGLEIPFKEKNTHGVIIGTTNGNIDVMERVINKYDMKLNHKELSDEASEMLSYFRPAEFSARISQYYNMGGISMVIPTACAAGNYSLGAAYSMIQEERSSIIVAGGADPFNRACYTIFYRLGAMSQKDCIPFDKNRTGMIVGEGSAMLVVEELEHALKRGARIYGEIKGYGLSCDAYHPTAPDPEGSGAILAMSKAIHNSNIDKKEITYISSHGTGTKANDAHEAKAMHRVFGNQMNSMYVNNIKAMMGHCMGAASAIEAVVANLSIYHQEIPDNINTKELDPAFNVRFPIHPPSKIKNNVDNVLSNAFAFGGNTCSVVFGKYKPNL